MHKFLKIVGRRASKWPKYEIFLFLLVFGASFYFTEVGCQTSNYQVRFFLTQAIVEHGTFSLSAYQDRLGIDHAVYQGNYYSDKPPGSSLMMIPAYLLLGRPINWLSVTFLRQNYRSRY